MRQVSLRFLLTLSVFSLLISKASSWKRVNSTLESNDTAQTRDSYYDIPWESDLFHLPSHVAYPGADWLQRIAQADRSASSFFVGNQVYSSAYAAMLDNRPLDFPCRNFNAYLNSIFFRPSVANALTQFILELGNSPDAEKEPKKQHSSQSFRLHVTHYLLCYCRNLIGAMIVYYGTALAFHYGCYVSPLAASIFEGQGRTRPTWTVMLDQIRLAQSSMMLYVLLPCVDEYLIEAGYTQVYYTIAEIGGWPSYLAYMLLYFTLVEIGIYWMHRTLHTNKWMYKHIHQLHHKYNKPETLTPWASIAFHPLDGILQASPYVAVLPLVPCHYLTHFGLLFFTAIWATYIHDAMDWNVWHIMGSKYHTVHHTHYIYNYGQVFTFCDRFWGTFYEPTGPTGVTKVNGERVKPNLSGRVGGGKKKE